MITVRKTFTLRLPASSKAEAEHLAAADGATLNQFIASAVAEKVATRRTADFFAERRARANWAAFDRFLSRTNGERPREGDERLSK